MRRIQLVISVLPSSCIFACADADKGNTGNPNEIENPEKPDLPNIPDWVVYWGLKQELSRADAGASVWGEHGGRYRPSMQAIDDRPSVCHIG